MLCSLYADDMVEGADSIGRLQKIINLLSTYCDDWGLQVNLEKTKIMVFRNGGVLKKNESWFFKGNKIEIVSFFINI